MGLAVFDLSAVCFVGCHGLTLNQVVFGLVLFGRTGPKEWSSREIDHYLRTKLNWRGDMNGNPDSADDDVVLCAEQAASILGCSTYTVYALCKSGTLPHYRIGKLLRLRRKRLIAWQSERESQSFKG